VGSRFKKVVGHQHSNHFLPSSSTFCCLGLDFERYLKDFRALSTGYWLSKKTMFFCTSFYWSAYFAL
jgi:hypothetical protein